MNTEKMKEMGIQFPEGFSVGFGREVVNPLPGTGMSGWGNPTVRLSNEVKDDLMVTCTALCDGEEVVLMYSIDNCGCSGGIYNNICNVVLEKFGIPGENVIVNATHTHTGPAIYSSKSPGMEEYLGRFYAAVGNTAETALSDLTLANPYMGRAYTRDISYVRRYLSKKDGSFLGNWPKMQYPEDARHETEPDTLLQVLRFEREGKKDVVLCNWQCHPCSELAGQLKTDVSADWIGIARQEVEEREGILFSYHQGACGNVVSGTKIVGEKYSRYISKGKTLYTFIREALAGATPISAGKIQLIREQFVAQRSRDWMERNEATTDFEKMYMTTFSIGDMAFATVPCEWHDTCGRFVREGSPFKMTFVCGYTNGGHSYIPATFCWENGGYEVKKCHFERGTGEKMTFHHIEKLNQLYQSK